MTIVFAEYEPVDDGCSNAFYRFFLPIADLIEYNNVSKLIAIIFFRLGIAIANANKSHQYRRI